MNPVDLDNLVIDNRDAGLFRVHRSAFTDPRILELERRRVFEQCWIYAGHASEVPRPGDFRTRSVAGRPVILARGDDGIVRVLLNTWVPRDCVRKARRAPLGDYVANPNRHTTSYRFTVS